MNLRLRLSRVLNKETLQTALQANWALLGVLVGFVLVAVSTGQFTNYDSQLEFQAASGVVKWGLPYMTFGNLLNQPPVGFYIDAFFFRLFGSSYDVGVAVTTAFGVGCVFLVYEIGKLFYGKRTGLFAAAVFGLTPWQVVLSRLFLIDVQSLFFSLLTLLVGIVAVRRGSWKLLLVSGFFFGVAFSTKLFAIFMLIPLALYFLVHTPRKLKLYLVSPVFFVPAYLLSYLWYEIMTGRGLNFILEHDDFSNYNPSGIAPSYFFVGNYLVVTLGALFLIAGALSLLVSFSQRRLFAKFFSFDVICALTIVAVAGVHTWMAVGQNLGAPYVGAIKYDYQFLPLFCLLTASLAKKSRVLLEPTVFRTRKGKLSLVIALSGLVLLLGSMVMNMQVLSTYANQKVIHFYVEGEVKYSFDNAAVPSNPFFSMAVQSLGFVFIELSLLWANRDVLKYAESFFSKVKPQVKKPPNSG